MTDTMRTAQIKAPDAAGQLGFVGCVDSLRARVVRIEWRGEGRPPRQPKIDCPVCATTHTVRPMWRKAVQGDRDRGPDVVLT